MLANDIAYTLGIFILQFILRKERPLGTSLFEEIPFCTPILEQYAAKALGHSSVM